MANYKELDVFIAQAKGEVDSKSVEVANARKVMKALAARYIDTKDKSIRTELAQITTELTSTILREKVNYIDLFADVKRTAIDVKANFKFERDLTSAEMGAKGVAGDRGTVTNDFKGMETSFVSTRPFISFLDMASGRLNFDRIAQLSAEKMDRVIAKSLEDTMFNAFSVMSAPNYGTGTGIDQTILKSQINTFGRFGAVSLLGDIETLGKLDTVSGWTSKLPESLALDLNANGYIGTFNTASVIKMTNPLLTGSMTETNLRKDLLYVLCSGDEGRRSLKVQFEGDLIMREHEDFETGDYEMLMGQIFGSAVVGAEHYMGVYRAQ
ncbi:hypothetical protein [Clostridium estertheticum]|uniref:hypothetical protein n=1 Tax=Clostridium estertheticum TaxID=238834 RepID=UPI001C0BFD48|nr:hypothetical protein [Clostridium estertheticum]MBU3186648.1 hypothetical protein [Clostridium estertheticum]